MCVRERARERERACERERLREREIDRGKRNRLQGYYRSKKRPMLNSFTSILVYTSFYFYSSMGLVYFCSSMGLFYFYSSTIIEAKRPSAKVRKHSTISVPDILTRVKRDLETDL
jgi:hypothetical protein